MNIFERLWFRFTHGGTDIKLANGGEPIEQITIKYKDFYLFVDIDAETQRPTGDFGWSEDPTMNPTMPLRDIYYARRIKRESIGHVPAGSDRFA